MTDVGAEYLSTAEPSERSQVVHGLVVVVVVVVADKTFFCLVNVLEHAGHFRFLHKWGTVFA